ncbi:uncharacterized protein TNIN_321261 [Trichonephila inaurata madagascariensis]|uniref:Uncharacterized protein n=1 Tax=Trichonephila inaurata madagascariensis TaxID=2747483 RepID=A0A8X6IM11_9ARAC|nr:uncharacterized protein TNIN_321261 [Trichonephila inaurata madagascariensis]
MALLFPYRLRYVPTIELASQSSRSPSLITCTTFEEDDERQAALQDLISHLEDTAALLRDYLLPPKTESFSSSNISSFEQTTFLLKYQIVLVLFTQIISILILSLFDHLLEKVEDTGYHILTIACGVVLQILNMLLPESWDFGDENKMKGQLAIGQFIKLLYLSVSAATLCGAANIQPNSWYVILIVCFQSLINFVYFASILAQTIGNYHSYTVQVRRSSSISQSKS